LIRKKQHKSTIEECRSLLHLHKIIRELFQKFDEKIKNFKEKLVHDFIITSDAANACPRREGKG